mgnify:CR=1 FL=1
MRDRVLAFLAEREQEQFALLEELVLIQSSSWNKVGVDAVGARLSEFLQGLGLNREVVAESDIGNQLIFRSAAWNIDRPGLLLVGHMDTVFPADTDFNWYRDDGVRVYGPGVIDMKGGLVVAVWALAALAHIGLLDRIPLTLICNSDEEIGSPASSLLVQTEAERSLLGLVFECGGLAGELVTGRKGKGGYLLKVHGRAGHAAFAGVDKASAILELSHKIIALERLNDPERQLVVNVGTVHGGIGPNTVADFATAEIDTRYLRLEDAELTAAKIEEITVKSTIKDTRGELELTGGRLPMEQSDTNHRLYRIIEQEATRLGIPCAEELRSGVSDANTIAATGIPVVDGLGPIGGCDHSDREYMIRESLPQRSQLAALAIIRCWQSLSNLGKVRLQDVGGEIIAC